MDIATELRTLADKIEQSQTALLDIAKAMNITDAIKTLRASFKRGSLKLEISWDGYEDPLDAEWSVYKGTDYKAFAKGTLVNCVREAVEKHKPHDVLERLEGDLKAKEELPL